MTKTKINVIEKLNNSPSKDPCRKEIDDEEERGDSADCKTPLNRRNQIMLRQDFDNLAHDVFALYCTGDQIHLDTQTIQEIKSFNFQHLNQMAWMELSSINHMLFLFLPKHT